MGIQMQGPDFHNEGERRQGSEAGQHFLDGIGIRRTKRTGRIAVSGEVVEGKEWASVKGKIGTVSFKTVTGANKANLFRRIGPDNEVVDRRVSVFVNPGSRTYITAPEAKEILGVEGTSPDDIVESLRTIYSEPERDADTIARVEPAYQFAIEASAAQAEHGMFDSTRADGIVGMVFAKAVIDPMVYVDKPDTRPPQDQSP